METLYEPLFEIRNLILDYVSGKYVKFLLLQQDSAGGMLGDWLGNLSVIAANPTKGDEQVITHLGDSLWKDLGEVVFCVSFTVKILWYM